MEFAILNTSMKIIEYGFQLKGVSEESRNAKAVLDVIQSDLNDLKRLTIELQDVIPPDRRRSIDDIIWRTNEVITLMAAPNKRSRKDIEQYGTVTIWRRITWTIRDGNTVKMYLPRLLACQTSLNGQLVSLRAMQPPSGRGALGRGASRLNVWEDRLSSTPDSGIMTEDLNDDDLWEDWLHDEKGTKSRDRSSTRRQPRQSHETHSRSRSRQIEPKKKDFSWLGKHAETELRGPSRLLDSSPVPEPSSDVSWLADSYDKAAKDDRENRRVSGRH